MAIMDKSGAMPTAIMASAEGVFWARRRAHIIQAGNTNSLDGRALNEALREAKGAVEGDRHQRRSRQPDEVKVAFR